MGVTTDEWIDVTCKFIRHAAAAGSPDEKLSAAHFARTLAQLLEHAAAQMPNVMPNGFTPPMPAPSGAGILDAILPMIMQHLPQLLGAGVGPAQMRNGGLGYYAR